jgi:hypothetical protein
MNSILKNEQIIHLIFTLSFLCLFALEFCYSLGKLHTIAGAFSSTVSFNLPVMPVFLISCALLVYKKIKTIK